MKCSEPRACFAQDARGNCTILSDTHFMRSCPFWKPPITIDEDAEFVIDGYKGRFKKIKGYDYLISTEGVVLNKRRREVKPVFEKSKCEMRVALYKNGKAERFRLEVLVGAAFLPGEGRIHHKNGDRTDCRLENLERW